jgi:hypothetical protein
VGGGFEKGVNFDGNAAQKDNRIWGIKQRNM